MKKYFIAFLLTVFSFTASYANTVDTTLVRLIGMKSTPSTMYFYAHKAVAAPGCTNARWIIVPISKDGSKTNQTTAITAYAAKQRVLAKGRCFLYEGREFFYAESVFSFN